MGELLPKISLITPSFNQGKFLRDTITSVLSQGYPTLEYIIIDGGSNDDSVDIIREYAPRLTYWESEKDNGFGHAINKGMARATGDIVGWLNSDDVLLPGALLTVGKYFQKHPDVGLVFGDRHVINERSELMFRRKYFFYMPGQFRFAKTLPQECTFWRKKTFDAVGGRLNEELRFAIDLDLWCRLSRITTIRHIPFFLGAFRDQPLSKSATLLDVGLHERKNIITRYFKRYPSPVALKIFQLWLGFLRKLFRATGLEAWKRNKILKDLDV